MMHGRKNIKKIKYYVLFIWNTEFAVHPQNVWNFPFSIFLLQGFLCFKTEIEVSVV
jgi:hypothetical protein